MFIICYIPSVQSVITDTNYTTLLNPIWKLQKLMQLQNSRTISTHRIKRALSSRQKQKE